MTKRILTIALMIVTLNACATEPKTAHTNVGNDNALTVADEHAEAILDTNTSNGKTTGNTAYEIDLSVANDSVEIEKWLKEADGVPADQLPDFFGKKFLGRPYVGKTLEKNKTEKLIINTRELDCTTYAENVMALSITKKHGKSTFHDFCDVLMNIRYEKPFAGKDNEPRVAYSHRNHYFTGWANSNIAQGYFTEITEPAKAFTATQRVKVDFMTKNPQYYVMLNETPTTADSIAAMERKLSDPAHNTYRYFPKEKLQNTNTEEFRNAIHEGDIVVILTNKAGLDTQHITLAHWEKDGLHIRHASSGQKKVINEPRTLYKYLMDQKTAPGVRVLRLK